MLCCCPCATSGVGPDVWNRLDATLLRELYYGPELMTGGIPAEARPSVREGQGQLAAPSRWSAAEFARAFGRAGYPAMVGLRTSTPSTTPSDDPARRGEGRNLHHRNEDRRRARTSPNIHLPRPPRLFSQIAAP